MMLTSQSCVVAGLSTNVLKTSMSFASTNDLFSNSLSVELSSSNTSVCHIVKWQYIINCYHNVVNTQLHTCTHTYTRTHTHTHTHACTHTYICINAMHKPTHVRYTYTHTHTNPHTHAHTHTHTHACTHTHICINAMHKPTHVTYTYTHVRTHKPTHTNPHTHTHKPTHAHTQTHTHKPTHARMHTPTHACTHAHTHTHACMHTCMPRTQWKSIYRSHASISIFSILSVSQKQRDGLFTFQNVLSHNTIYSRIKSTPLCLQLSAIIPCTNS